MGSYKPLIFAIGFLLMIGLVIPFFLGFFIDIDSVEIDGFTNQTVYIIENGFELDVIPFTDWGTFDINPFTWLGSGMQNALSDSLVYVSIFPSWLSTFILILCTISIIYGLLKLIPFNS